MPSEIAWGTQIPQLNGTLYVRIRAEIPVSG